MPPMGRRKYGSYGSEGAMLSYVTFALANYRLAYGGDHSWETAVRKGLNALALRILEPFPRRIFPLLWLKHPT